MTGFVILLIPLSHSLAIKESISVAVHQLHTLLVIPDEEKVYGRRRKLEFTYFPFVWFIREAAKCFILFPPEPWLLLLLYFFIFLKTLIRTCWLYRLTRVILASLTPYLQIKHLEHINSIIRNIQFLNYHLKITHTKYHSNWKII